VRDQGWLVFESEAPFAPPWREVVFARELWPVHAELVGLPESDRIAPVLAALPADLGAVEELVLEHPDTNEGKALSVFCRKFAHPLRAALKAGGMRLAAAGAPRLHLFFTDSRHAFVGLADPARTAPWPMGIPRLKLPREAPSRSTLKLDEAFLALLTDAERERLLAPGMRAVDLGAAPGGWTWQLVRRGLAVTAIDNGPMDAALLETGQVVHLREDGFRWTPPKPVDWVVCDMVEQPQRVAALMAEWLGRGHAARAVFNLKLPMKQRWRAVADCLGSMRARLPAATLRAKQLYHDREEITVFAAV
jgi:23S rRNA (cytidine2498-2'-O)-methyltransferase